MTRETHLPPYMLCRDGAASSRALIAANTEAAKRGYLYIPSHNRPARIAPCLAMWSHADGSIIVLRGRTLTLTVRT